MSKKNLTRTVMDSYFPTASTPLRRSINVQKLVPEVLVENDDEAERYGLQRKSIINNVASSRQSVNKRYSLSLSYLSQMPESQLKEHISHCIKLSIENKINVKNAFSLEMIDFMTFMIAKSNSNNIDLQLAGTSLDVMTKIYVYRVDGLHTEVLKIAGALDKQQKKDIDELKEKENEKNVSESPVRKKIKRNKHNIISTESTLKGNIRTMCPSISTIGLGDSNRSDMLYQVVLPIHANSGFYYHPYNDIIVDELNEESTIDKDSSEYTIPSIKDCSHLNICSSFSDFKFLNWSNKDEPETQEVVQEDNTNRFQFDLDICTTENDESEPGCYFDINEDEDKINLCRGNAQEVQNVVDLRSILSKEIPGSNNESEYSFIQNSFIHWAGPSYWKIKRFGKSLSNNNGMEVCCQKALKKKQEIVLNYKDDTPHTVVEKFLPGKAIKIQAKTAKIKWKKEKITLPKNTHYDISGLYKLYICPSIDTFCNNNEDHLNATQLCQHYNHDYDSENDMAEHCFTMDTNNQVMQENNDVNELRSNGDNSIECQAQFTGDNLVTMPKLTQKVFLQYAVRAKRIDMHQLKQAVWNSLTLQRDEERKNIQNEVQIQSKEEIKESKTFSTIYKSLPSMLSETNVKALSFPIAFVSLLHLSNEKSLKLSSLPGFSDIIVEKN